MSSFKIRAELLLRRCDARTFY